jgi:hypothetical protein
MDILKQADLEQLMEISSEWCVTLYMPAHKVGQEGQQDPIRLRNLIAQAQENLLEYGLHMPQIQALLRPAEELLTDGEQFWQHQSDGLAIFLSDHFSRTLRLPLKFEELVVVAGNFHLKPLLPLFSKDGKFYILAVSMNEIRLLLCTKYTIDEVELVGVPTSMKEALWMDDPEKFTGFHTSASSPGRGGERQAIYYGHAAKSDEDKKNLLRYFQFVDAGLNDLLADKEIPMVLAGVDYLLPIYHEANSYSGLLEEGLVGNHDELNKKDLHHSAWKLVEPIFEQTQKKDMERFEQFYGQQNKLASADLKTVLKAAQFGQVETLFVPLGVHRWGRYDPQQNRVTLDTKSKPENEDLLEFAVKQTIINSGQVYAVEPENMPGEGDLAAILRYAV